MTIRRRLTLAFVAILALFAVNEGIQVLSTRLRAGTMRTLDQALTRQALMASVHQRVNNVHKEMAIMGQNADAGVTVGRDALDADISVARDDIARLAALSTGADRTSVDDLAATYAKLSVAWRGFYDTLGVDAGQAILFQVQAEPLGRRVLQILPVMQQQQTEVVQSAEARYARVSRVTEQVSIAIFVVSMLVAAGIAYGLSRYLTTRLSDLSLGASLIGAMNLDHRITVRSKDEIGRVAGAFNDMAGNLARAREELTAANTELQSRNDEIERQRQVSQSLLLNILPQQVADELASNGRFAPRYYEDVTVVFTDFVGFTLNTEKLAAEELVDVLHGYFSGFDEITTRYGLEKLKTIGDSYFCAGGIPTRTPTHPVDAILAAFELIDQVKYRTLPNGANWAIRIGVHTGPVVAGVVGLRKFAFDVWGDTVNLGSRMESGGAPNRINVSESVYRRTKDFFSFESRGRMLTKEKKELEMFLVTGIQPALLAGADPRGGVPPAFAHRYRTYFSKEVPAFPACLLEQSDTAAPPAGAAPVSSA